MNLSPDGAAARCRDAVARLTGERAVERIWAPDPSFWKVEAVARRGIENSLGWLIPDGVLSTLSELEEFVEATRGGTDRVLVLGTGGPSRAARFFARTFGSSEGFPAVDVLDATEPSTVAQAAASSDPSRTIYVVSSRSGTAIEPNVLFDYFFDEASRRLGDRAGERFVVITDPGSALEKAAGARRVLRVFPGDPHSRGNFGALSHFGLVPAAFLGVDVRELLRRARRMSEACRAEATENPGLLLGAALGAEALAGRDKLTFSMGRPAEHFGFWLEALIAETTGKEGRGIVPVDREPLGRPEAYGSDRFFVRYEGKGGEDAVAAGRLASLVENGHSLVSFVVQDALDLGAEMFRWQFAAAVAAHLLGVNPFDRPESPEGEDRANAILSGAAPAPPAPLPGVDVDGDRLSDLLASIRPGDYFAILAYLPESAEIDAALQAIRVRVRDARRVATTIGFGPRFQQAAGRLHKAGANTGVFLQLTREPSEVKAIPGRPWGFGEVLAAQAAGDLAALEARGRRVARIHLAKGAADGIRELGAAVDRALAA